MFGEAVRLSRSEEPDLGARIKRFSFNFQDRLGDPRQAPPVLSWYLTPFKAQFPCPPVMAKAEDDALSPCHDQVCTCVWSGSEWVPPVPMGGPARRSVQG